MHKAVCVIVLVMSVCLSVFLSVFLSVCLSNDNFRKHGHRKFIFTHAVYLQGIHVRFVYDGNWVKVNVTGAKNVENYCCRNAVLLYLVLVLVLKLYLSTFFGYWYWYLYLHAKYWYLYWYLNL